jgi:hypothetical protein
MQEVKIPVFEYTELSKAAQATVVSKYIDNEWFDYSDHEKAEYGASLAVFNASFNLAGCEGQWAGEKAKAALVACANSACLIQARSNKFYAASFNKNYSGEIKTQQDALAAIDSCILTGVCTDFYFMDTIAQFLKGENYQELTLKELLEKAKANARIGLKKQCRHYRTKAYVHECLIEQCESVFFADGTEVPEAITKLLAA